MSFFLLAWEAQLISYKEPSIRREWWDCRLLMGSRDGLATRNGLGPGQVAQLVRTMVGKLISHRAANRVRTGLERCPDTPKLGVWSPTKSNQWMPKKVEKQILPPPQINKKKEMVWIINDGPLLGEKKTDGRIFGVWDQEIWRTDCLHGESCGKMKKNNIRWFAMY